MDDHATRETTQGQAYECARAWVALRQIHLLVSESLAAELADACGLTINEFEVLAYLQGVAPGRARMGDLAGVVPLSQSAISRLVARLERLGLVGRCEHEGDRRSTLLELTDAGADCLTRATEVHAVCIQRHLTGRLTDEEQETLVALLSRLGNQPE